jgi:hypothetical protein
MKEFVKPLKPLKIICKSAEHLEKVQNYLFSNGYRWGGRYESAPYELKKGFKGDICIFPEVRQFFFWDLVKPFYFTEVELIEKVSYELKEIPKREVVTIGEKSYYKDELEVALKNINPI